VKSKIYQSEKVENKDRKFGENPYYFPAMMHDINGSQFPALFTNDQIQVAIDRATRNPEDIETKSFLERIFGV